MKHRRALQVAIPLTILCLTLSSCTSSGSHRAEVKNVRVDPAAVSVNEQIDVQITFKPDRDEDYDGDTVVQDTDLVIKLPQGVDYIDDSSELDNSLGSDFDDRTPNRVELCADGTRALTYEFDGDELRNGENRVRIKAKAYEVAGNGVGIFKAQADSRISFACAIAGDDQDSIDISS